MSESVAPSLAPYLERVRNLTPLIRAHAAESEQQAKLSPAIVEAFHDAGLFRIFLPGEIGGADLTIPDGLRVFEAAAQADGAAGWNLAIGASSALATNYVSAAACKQIFSDRRALLAGSFNPTSRAERRDGGWLFTGKATYASGCSQANWLTAAAIVVNEGKPQITGGMPPIRAAIFPSRDCRILNTWSVSGLRGTGSHDCVFENVLVPEEFTFEFPDPRSPWRSGAFANIPLLAQLGGTLAAVALGIARHAIDALMEVAQAKVPTGGLTPLRERPAAQINLAQAEGLLRAARAYLYDAMNEIWRRGLGGDEFTPRMRAEGRLASVVAVKLAAQAVDLVYETGGITSIQTSSDIERCWRDVHTVTQHVIVSSGRYEVIGRVLLGLLAGSPII